MERIILASHSPRRQELLGQAGIPFECVTSDADETTSLSGLAEVEELSLRKASTVSKLFPGRYILAADTLVSIDGIMLGKPSGPEDAASMIRRLSGRTHHVMTGVTVISPSGSVFTSSDNTSVSFCVIPEDEILDYTSGSEWADKAGAYAVQGRAGLWVDRLDGCYSSVVGLPLYMVRRLLIMAGYSFVSDD